MYNDQLRSIIGDREVEEVLSPDHSLRLKVTGLCAWSCKFCHQEGGWDNIVGVGWGNTERVAFEKLFADGFNEVHITGGEPTLNKELPNIVEGLRKIGFQVKMTSVLTSIDVLEAAVKKGVEGVSVSLHTDLSAVNTNSGEVPERAITDLISVQSGVGHEKARKQALQVASGIDLLVNLGMVLRGNTVISSEADIERCVGILEYALSKGIFLRFMNDLSHENAVITQRNIIVD